MMEKSLVDLSEMGRDEELGTGFRDRLKGELYSLLCTLTTGEANTNVRSMIPKGYGYCGFTA